jgi:glycerol-3-phosphate dehydrogenase
MNVAIAMTAIQQGAAVANYVEVTELVKNQDRIAGARVKDTLTGDTWDIQAKVSLSLYNITE